MTKKPNPSSQRARAHAHEKAVPAVIGTAQGNPSLRISDAAAKPDLAALRKELGTRNRARSFLRDVGILTPTGKLSRRFGG